MVEKYIPRVYAVKRSAYSDKPIIAFASLAEAIEFVDYWNGGSDDYDTTDFIIEIPLFGGYKAIGNDCA